MNMTGFLDRVANASPTLRSLYDQHLEDGEEVLPHVLMGSYASWALEVVNDNDQSKDLEAFLDVVELGLREGGDAVINVIAVSLLEHMPHQGESGPLLVQKLGPLARASLEDMESWHEGRSE